jgi:hypothetical protein
MLVEGLAGKRRGPPARPLCADFQDAKRWAKGVEVVQKKKHRTSAEPTLMSILVPLLHINRELLAGDDMWELLAALLQTCPFSNGRRLLCDWSGAYLAWLGPRHNDSMGAGPSWINWPARSVYRG